MPEETPTPETNEIPVSTPETTPPAAETPATPETPAETEETFPRTYVEELRKEAAEYRTKYGTYRDAFSAYGDDEREAFLQLARDLAENPSAAARRMVEIAKGLTGDEFERLLSDEGPKPLTAEDLDAEFRKREQAREEQKAVEAVVQEAKGLGYEEGTPEYADLMYRAYNQHEGSIAEAHKAREEQRQAIIDEYLSAKAQDADGFVPVTADGAGAAETGSGPPKNFSEARAALQALLDTQAPG